LNNKNISKLLRACLKIKFDFTILTEVMHLNWDIVTLNR